MKLQYKSLRKLTAEIVTELRLGNLTLNEACEIAGVSRTACWNARAGLTWKMLPTPPVPKYRNPKNGPKVKTKLRKK